MHHARPLLIHYHIFKNAGTSFEWALEEALGTRFRRYDSQTPSGVLSPNDIARYVADTPEATALSSHQAILPAPKMDGREIFTSILLRDPIARIGSIYAFERRQEASTPGALKAKELDFKGYVEWRLSSAPMMLCNYQVYFCSRTEKGSVALAIDDAQLEKAIANLDRLDIVGTVERYDEWLALARSVLSEPFPGISLSSSRQNVSANRPETSKGAILDNLIEQLGQGLTQQLVECNRLDMCLHQVADALLTRKLAEQKIEIALLDAYNEAGARRSKKSEHESVRQL